MIKTGHIFFFLALLQLALVNTNAQKIEPSWESMAENYQVPEWFKDGKIGVWMHWGIPSATDENRPNDGSHYGRRMYGPAEGQTGMQRQMNVDLTAFHTKRYGHPSEFGYENLVPLFKAENWDPDGLAKFFKDCGARFIMPVACHHDNFDMYDSFHPWNSVDMGPKRDILQEWKDAAYKQGMKFGVSTHLYWSPRFFATARQYQEPGTLAWKLFNMDYDPRGYANQEAWNRHWFDRCWEIIDKYDPDMFNNDSPFPSEKFGDASGVKLFSDFVNRDLEENGGKQTVIASHKSGGKDRAAFTYNLERGSAGDIKANPWMWATDLSGGWFYRKGAVNRMSIPVMIGNAVDAISKNGVVMLNVALRGDGTLPENQAEYLTTFGEFLKINSEGIYGSRPWKRFGEGPLKMKDGRQGENHTDFSQEDIRFTVKDGNLYAFVLAPPTKDILIKTLKTGGLLTKTIRSISLLGSNEEISWDQSEAGLIIKLPKSLPELPVIGFKIMAEHDHYPEFSWDHVPLYQHMRKSTAFTKEELKYLASFPIVTLEKITGSKTYGSSEKGSLAAARAIKEVNPKTKVLYYRNVMCNYNTYEVNAGLETIPGAFLVDSSNGNMKLHRNVREVYDLSNPQLRKWWVDHCVEMSEYPEIDGIFLDGNIKALEPVFLGKEIGLEKKQEVADGYELMMKDMRNRMGSDELMLANLIRARLKNSGLDYMQYMDGSYLEGFETAANGIPRLEYIAKGIDAVQKAAREGKIICMSMGLGRAANSRDRIDDSRQKVKWGPETLERLDYTLAIFLICAEKYSYFLAHDGYAVDDNKSAAWLKRFPQYDKPLGPPRGPATKNGYTYTREFEHASVWLDIENGEAKIEWQQ